MNTRQTERQAHALTQLVTEVNAHAPTRSKASDGGKASDAHNKQNPTSDHRPNAAGVWRAYDFTNDPTHGLACAVLAILLAAMFGHHPAMMSGSYIIWDGRIISYDRRREGWRKYTGTNPHTKHLHLSVSTSPAGYDSRKPWNLWKPDNRVTKVVKQLAASIDLLTLAAEHSGKVRKAALLAAATSLRGVVKALRKWA